MSSSDVRDILSLPARQAEGRAPRGPPVLPGDNRGKQRPEGMSRELYALLGPNAPSLLMGHGAEPVAGTRAFQPKFIRRQGAAPAQRWVWTPFRSTARNDTQMGEEPSGLVMYHWRPMSESGQDFDSTWASFNTTSQVFRYTDEEYTQLLEDDDWTQKETDYLIDLCDEYDLRFIVIADRYEWPGKTRTVEDIKGRYYSICRRLVRSRISDEDLETRQCQLQAFAYDREQEIERKRAVQKLFTRTPEQLAEEEALYVETRRLEQNETRFAKEREELLRLLGGWDSLPSCSTSTVATVGAGIVVEDRASSPETDKKHKKRRMDKTPTPAPRGRPESRHTLADAQNHIWRFQPELAAARPLCPHLVGISSIQPPVAGSVTTKSDTHAHHGAYLRSTRMLSFRPNLYSRATQALGELHPPIGARLVFPTATNVEKWETLLGAVASSLEVKKQLDRAEAEYKALEARLNGETLAAAPADDDGSAESMPEKKEDHEDFVSTEPMT
ncbi:swr complex subunit [Malassezia cuniculi]|uniref:SWR1-complex protein 4 n=1 Tax=Malassezia cuniculi TaxID=948313 RepID=A0AAF0EWK8_9BASI|nr:swr complex subunit [Malassezia cuniculi]